MAQPFEFWELTVVQRHDGVAERVWAMVPWSPFSFPPIQVLARTAERLDYALLRRFGHVSRTREWFFERKVV